MSTTQATPLIAGENSPSRERITAHDAKGISRQESNEFDFVRLPQGESATK
jgi:hypothetical protein